MYYSVLRLPNGTELKGGEAGSTLKALTLHTAVNAGQEFTIGSAFSDYIEAEIWADPGGSLQITAGDALTYYRQDDAGNRTKVGVFYAEKPTRTKRNSYKVTAYDTMSKLDADFSGWLHANQAQFPKTIWQLVQLACQRAGVTLASSSLPINGSYSVQAFYADDLTCRQIISWAAEAAGCYAHMNADGKLQFLTYTDKRSTVKITPDGASNSTAYYADSLSYEDYTVKAIEKVQIRQSDSDVGVIYPDSTTATNTYVVQGNLLLTTGTEANLKSVVQNLYNALKNVKSDSSPIHWQYGAIARLPKGAPIEPLLYGGYSSISLGYIGLYEVTKLMKGCSHTQPGGTEFALRLMNRLRRACDDWKKETNIGFALYGPPAESLCYRFARIDKERFGTIPDVTDKGYYTNSYHVDVREHIDAFEKFTFESQFQKISTGGCISYVEIPNMRHNLEALKEVVRFIYDNIQYAEFNTKSDYCQVCGYDGEIIINDDNQWECPACHNKDQTKMNVTRRTCGYLGENYWNVGKTKEIKSRVLHL